MFNQDYPVKPNLSATVTSPRLALTPGLNLSRSLFLPTVPLSGI